jgi:hypothetical protein
VLILGGRDVEALYAIPWFAWIPIVAIVGGVVSHTVTTVAGMAYRHRERMAMIQMGLHPDAEPGSALDPHGKPATVDEV